jgi:hypothetical protein
MTYAEAIAIINRNPDHTYVVQIDGEFMTLKGHVMRGFLQPGDVLDYFKEWDFS